jgi:Domain of unknown function (DUF4145)
MARDTYFPPKFSEEEFNCPHCGVYAHQYWREVYFSGGQATYSVIHLNVTRTLSLLDPDSDASDHVVSISKCGRCSKVAIWRYGKLINPSNLTVEPPSPDMPEPIKTLYEEARSIVDRSSRAAVALLRLALEQLLPLLGAKKGNIDNMIAELVANGLNVSVQRALDSIRVIGNEAVHPGLIDLEDNPDTAQALFKILNFIIEKTITEKNEVDGIYELIPASKRKYIEEVRPVKNK